MRIRRTVDIERCVDVFRPRSFEMLNAWHELHPGRDVFRRDALECLVCVSRPLRFLFQLCVWSWNWSVVPSGPGTGVVDGLGVWQVARDYEDALRGEEARLQA